MTPAGSGCANVVALAQAFELPLGQLPLLLGGVSSSYTWHLSHLASPLSLWRTSRPRIAAHSGALRRFVLDQTCQRRRQLWSALGPMTTWTRWPPENPSRAVQVAASESGEVGRAPSNSSPSVIACQPCPNPSSENEGDAYVAATPFWYKTIIAMSPRAGPSPASTSSTDTDVAESVGHKPIRVSCAARRASLRLHRQLCDRLEEVANAQALGHVGCWSDDDSMEMSSIVIGDSPIGIMPAEYGPREPTTVEITERLLRSNDPVIRSLYAEFKAVADSSDSDVEGSASNRLSESDSDAEGSASEAMTCSSHASDGAPDTPNAKRCRFDLEVAISV